jgi:hypothetical protein
MSAIYQHISALEEAGLIVYMHFDYADDAVEIKADRSAEATLAVRPRIHDNVLIRVPGWAPPESVRIEVDGRPAALHMVGSFAYLGRRQVGVNSQIVLRHALPTRRTQETMAAGDTYHFAWRGDQITGVHPNEWPLPFYPTLESS